MDFNSLLFTGISILLPLAAAWPFAELWLAREVREAFPKLAVGLGIALSVYLIAIVAIALLFPRIGWLLAGVAAIAIPVQLWRARPDFGKKRGLPPGSLALLPTGAWLDPRFYQTQGELYGPVFKSSHFMKPMVCIIGLETGLEVLRKYEETAVVTPEAAFARYVPCSYIRSMSAEDHRKYRPILQAAVSDEVTDAHSELFRTVLRRQLREMAGRPLNEFGGGLRGYSTEAIYQIAFSVFFGIPPGSEESQQFREFYRLLDRAHQRRATVWSPPDQIVQNTLTEILSILNRRVDQFEIRPKPSPEQPPASYMEAAWRHGGREAVNDVVQLNLVFLLQVTCTDLGGLFDWLVKKMSDNPEWQARLRDTLEEHGFEADEAIGLADRIVTETLRLEQSEHIYRKIIQPIEINGFHIPKGWLLRICVRESHHCSPAFEDPESFNPDRFLNRTYSPTEYSPFGMFRRRCIGVHTGIRLGGVFVRTLVEAYEWEVTHPGKPEFRGWHWSPGSSFAVRLKPRGVQEGVHP